jgi:hypothetical protein
MKTSIAGIIAASALAALPVLAQDDLEPGEPWVIQGHLLWQDTQFARDALQSRADFDDDDDTPFDWKDGDSDGDGFGARISVGKGPERLNVTYLDSDYDYVLDILPSPTSQRQEGRHSIQNDRLDLQVDYSRVMGGGYDELEQGAWGWRLGIRYIDIDKTVDIFERDRDREVRDSFGGGVEWKFLTGGYFGEWRPFNQTYFRILGGANLLLGEVSGISRTGNDPKIDGFIEERYDDDESLAYGANFSAGFGVEAYHVSLGVLYGREWLYSFEATQSGTVVFPDNEDALFIENQHFLTAYLGVSF